MKNRSDLLNFLKKNTKNIRFSRLCNIAEEFGFKFRGGRGSHRIYVKKGIKEILNFQNFHGKAKPYQVRQLIKVIEQYNLKEEKDNDV
jgi:predicted RNA binding protein YcfA (HicA-like mRNA interferase family)